MKETSNVSDWQSQNLFRYMIYWVNSAAIVVANVAILLRYIKKLKEVRLITHHSSAANGPIH